MQQFYFVNNFNQQFKPQFSLCLLVSQIQVRLSLIHDRVLVSFLFLLHIDIKLSFCDRT